VQGKRKKVVKNNEWFSNGKHTSFLIVICFVQLEIILCKKQKIIAVLSDTRKLVMINSMMNAGGKFTKRVQETWKFMQLMVGYFSSFKLIFM
jgi:hypothetical protein